jgi:hypothetical protein
VTEGEKSGGEGVQSFGTRAVLEVKKTHYCNTIPPSIFKSDVTLSTLLFSLFSLHAGIGHKKKKLDRTDGS